MVKRRWLIPLFTQNFPSVLLTNVVQNVVQYYIQLSCDTVMHIYCAPLNSHDIADYKLIFKHVDDLSNEKTRLFISSAEFKLIYEFFKDSLSTIKKTRYFTTLGKKDYIFNSACVDRFMLYDTEFYIFEMEFNSIFEAKKLDSNLNGGPIDFNKFFEITRDNRWSDYSMSKYSKEEFNDLYNEFFK